MGLRGQLGLFTPSLPNRPFAGPGTPRAGGVTVPSAQPGTLKGHGDRGVGTPGSPHGRGAPGAGGRAKVSRAGLRSPRRPRNGGLRFPALPGWSPRPLVPSEHDGGGIAKCLRPSLAGVIVARSPPTTAGPRVRDPVPAPVPVPLPPALPAASAGGSRRTPQACPALPGSPGNLRLQGCLRLPLHPRAPPAPVGLPRFPEPPSPLAPPQPQRPRPLLDPGSPGGWCSPSPRRAMRKDCGQGLLAPTPAPAPAPVPAGAHLPTSAPQLV